MHVRPLSVVPNPCGDNNGGCSHLCLLSSTSNSGFVRVCPDDLPLINKDGRHCGKLLLKSSMEAKYKLYMYYYYSGHCVRQPSLNLFIAT